MKQFKVYTSPEECLDCGSNEKLARKLFNNMAKRDQSALLVVETGTDVYYVETVWSDGFTARKEVSKFYHIKEAI